jgi:uncharacterized membrane protein YgdD (TMEM256/DUF423 family)
MIKDATQRGKAHPAREQIMRTWAHTLFMLAGLFGASGVALGAFGAHALKAVLDPRGVAIWQTATLYHLVHSLALLALGAVCCADPAFAGATRVGAVVGFALGIVLFSGSLYALALGAPRMLGAVTPLGGVALIVGWLSMAMHAWRR